MALPSYGALGVGLGVSALLLLGLIKVGGAVTPRRKTLTVNGTTYEASKSGDVVTVTVVGFRPITSLRFNSTTIIEASGDTAMLAKMVIDAPLIAAQTSEV